MKHTSAVILCAFLLAVGLAACQPRPAAEPVDQTLSLGVAGFTQPLGVEDLLAGNIPPGSGQATPEDLRSLDAFLAAQLAEEGRPFVAADLTDPCREQADAARAEAPNSALDYWVQVGQCASVDYLLVPAVIYWKERQGTAVGVSEPAGVVVDIYVVDVKGYGLVTRYHYEETQVSLAENLLTLGRFVSRSGQWVTAEELAREAVVSGLKQMGL